MGTVEQVNVVITEVEPFVVALSEETIAVAITEETLAYSLVEEAITLPTVEETYVVEDVTEQYNVAVQDETLHFQMSEVIVQNVPAAPTQELWVTEVDVGALRVVYLNDNEKVAAADPSQLSQVSRVVGLTLVAALAGSYILVESSGLVEDVSWSWVAGDDLYIGAGGLLTSVVPSTGIITKVAYALSPTKVMVVRPEIIIL